MADDARFAAKPHPYTLTTFHELPPRIMGPDSKCTCTACDLCPLGRQGAAPRCTLEDLRDCDRDAIRRRAWQSGGDE
jgi:hypothetical protein